MGTAPRLTQKFFAGQMKSEIASMGKGIMRPIGSVIQLPTQSNRD